MNATAPRAKVVRSATPTAFLVLLAVGLTFAESNAFPSADGPSGSNGPPSRYGNRAELRGEEVRSILATNQIRTITFTPPAPDAATQKLWEAEVLSALSRATTFVALPPYQTVSHLHGRIATADGRAIGFSMGRNWAHLYTEQWMGHFTIENAESERRTP